MGKNKNLNPVEKESKHNTSYYRKKGKEEINRKSIGFLLYFRKKQKIKMSKLEKLM